VKRALVTGASGFVGANVARRLLEDGHETHVLVRQSYRPWRLDEIASSLRSHEVDLRDREGVKRVVARVRPDWVFHLAAFGAYSTQTGIERMVETNLMGSVALLDACAETGIEAFVQTGSSSEYGYKDHAANEGEPLEPNSHYAITKAAATHYCEFTARQRNLHAVTVRLYSIYGPYEEPTRLIPTLIVLGLEGKLPPLVSPRTARDFVYVDDAVEAMMRIASQTTLPRGSVYNICTGQQSSLEFVVSAVRRTFDIAKAPVWGSMQQRSWDTDVWVGSPVSMARDSGWRSTIDIESGLRKTAAWFLQNPRMHRLYASHIAGASHPTSLHNNIGGSINTALRG
jgi:UDP-glucose 4-epimerase